MRLLVPIFVVATLACAGGGAPEPVEAPAPPEPTALDVPTDPPGRVHPVALWEKEFSLEKERYPHDAVADGDLATTWVVDSPLVLQYTPFQLASIRIVPGYAKSAGVWADNRRVEKVAWTVYGADDAGGAREIRKGTAELHPPATLPEDPWVAIPMDPPIPEPVVAVRLEVVEASGETRYPDICVSEVEALGWDLDRAPWHVRSDVWEYAEPLAGLDVGEGERLEAAFDRIDFEQCELRHSGTGGGGPVVRGECEGVDDVRNVKGTRWDFDGDCALPGGDGEPCPSEEVRFDVRLAPVGACFARIDGHPFSRGRRCLME